MLICPTHIGYAYHSLKKTLLLANSALALLRFHMFLLLKTKEHLYHRTGILQKRPEHFDI